MMADGVRMGAYRAALSRVVKPGAVVVDLGAGIGIMSLIACQLGARRVYAIEPDDLIEVARELAASNGFADRLQIIQERSERVSLPERADVLVSDLRGVLPFYADHIPVLMDARRRFLAPGGVLIPEHDQLHAAVVSSARAYDENRRPWRDGAAGLDTSPAEKMAVNQLAKPKLGTADIVTPPRAWASIDYRSDASPSARGTVSWRFEGRAVGHGLRVWFDTTLAAGIGFSNRAGAAETVYGAVFLPWSEPVELEPGDEIATEISADLVGKDYVWRWNTTVTPSGGGAGAHFRQSSFLGEPLGAARLLRRRPERATKLNDEGQVAAFVLAEMKRERALGDVARDLIAAFPGRFPDEAAALAQAATLADRYGA
jgi:protein arginine N-methyltransferase 1